MNTSSQTRGARGAHGRLLFLCAVFVLFCLSAPETRAARAWSEKLDGRVQFYQATEVGVLVAGTQKSLYGLDGETGQVLWRRKNARLGETEVAPVPGTDLLLLSPERGDRTRLEAVDLLTGDALWRAERARGGVMQLALDLDANLLAVVFARDARGEARAGFKRRPVVHVFELSTGRELWERELESEVEMMPSSRTSDDDEVAYTLDNYRPPVFLDGRLYLFYEGVTSLDARTGKERRREKFRVNEEGLALTEADPVADEAYIFTTGRGRVRAVSRSDGREAWEAKDLGTTPEMILTRGALYVRTGGQFARLGDAETSARGPFGVSALDPQTGKTLWRYKGADKGITNMALPDASTVLVADRDDLIFLDAATGKRRLKVSHKIEGAAFVLLNERGEAVVGGRNEIAAFDAGVGRERWRSRHTPPGRGLFRTVGAVAARAASLYFRYGGTATTVFRGARLLSAAGSLRWSGLAAHATLPDLSSLATNYARERARERFVGLGVLSRARQAAGLRERLASRSLNLPRPSVDVDVQERLFDRLDPAQQLERLSRFLWRRQRLAALRGEWMYFYTDLKGVDGNGLVGVNVNTGAPERAVRLEDPDARFISDESAGLLYVSKGDRLHAYSLNGGE
ncbi:MAG TPA: PQQ-binding-like beta-propeller repeat protein [Pyrinomonadaceae bacterium]|nr:PQQ-binding-like beta-propeller repeat protein [Pyrinomonadaceae bacterium]